LLFILDDISSYFAKDMFLRVLVANALGTFCLACYRGDLSNYSVIDLGSFHEPNGDIFLNRFEEMPLYVLVGAVGGAMGGFFCFSYELLNRESGVRLSSKTSQLLGVVVLSLVTSVLLFYVPSMKWTCKSIIATDNNLAESDTITYGRRFFCQEGQVNELATILFGSRGDAITRILANPKQFQPRTLLTVGALFYVLMVFTITSSLPSGVFTPTVLCGASLGGAAGLIFKDIIDPEITPSTFALLGVAAMLAGIQHSTVSICVILVEGTGQVKVLIPVIVTVVVARYVAGLVHKNGIYETSMGLKGYPYLDHEEKKRYDMFEVKDIMSEPAVTVAPREKAHRLVNLLRNSSHHGFPVVEKKTGKFLGLMRRKQIVALLECGVFDYNQDIVDDSSPSNGMSSPSWTPKPGVSKEPLMHWAYHIKDDRYDYLKNSKDLEEDEFDDNSYLLSIRDAVHTMQDVEWKDSNSRERITIIGDDTLPPLNSSFLHSLRESRRNGSQNSLSSGHSAPTGFARVGQDQEGKVVVTWLNPDFRNQYVNLAAVMNKGSYYVPDDFPVSKAHYLFTKLGLRWIVVLGGSSGGEVVGVLTRSSFLRSHISEQTGAEI
jgi:H+/Cl- antiporter ClcA